MSTKEEDKFEADVTRLFSSELGEAVLNELELRYCRRLMQPDAHRTAYAVGKSDLVMFLKELSETQ